MRPVSAGLRVIPASVSMQLNRSSMQLTDEQRKAIIRWAERTPELGAVILYGSRSTGKADAISDVNLALVMMENFTGDRRADAYLNNCEIWEAELAATLDLAVHLVLLDPPSGLQVPSFLAKGHTELWQRRN
jgi:predicted nucleotidyltransferase